MRNWRIVVQGMSLFPSHKWSGVLKWTMACRESLSFSSVAIAHSQGVLMVELKASFPQMQPPLRQMTVVGVDGSIRVLDGFPVACRFGHFIG